MQTSEIYAGEQPSTWQEARMVGIGGSDAAAIMGVNPWCSPYTLWCRKAGLIEPIQQTEPMKWGHRLEQAIADYYEEESHNDVYLSSDPDIFDGKGCPAAQAESFDDGVLFRNREHPWKLASVDRLIWSEERGWGVLEIKNVSVRLKDHWGSDVPQYVRLQNLHYQSVLGLSWGAVAVLFGGNDPGWKDVVPSPGERQGLHRSEKGFWESLMRGECPEADGSESTRDTLAELYPRAERGTRKLLPDQAIVWDDLYVHHKLQEKMHAEKKKAYETLIRAEIGSSEQGVLPSGVVWKTCEIESRLVEAHERKGYRRYTRSEPKS